MMACACARVARVALACSYAPASSAQWIAVKPCYLEKAAGMEDVRATVRAVAAGRRGRGELLEAIA